MHQRTESFLEFVYAETGLSKKSQVADKSGMARSTFYSQLDASRVIPSETVIAVCQNAEISVLDGLEAAGYINDADVQRASTFGKLDSLPDSALLEHLLHRATTREQTNTTETGPSNSPSTPLAPVTGLHTDPLPYAALTEGDGNTMDNVPLEGDE